MMGMECTASECGGHAGNDDVYLVREAAVMAGMVVTMTMGVMTAVVVAWNELRGNSATGTFMVITVMLFDI